jgi:hypothetical protein
MRREIKEKPMRRAFDTNLVSSTHRSSGSAAIVAIVAILLSAAGLVSAARPAGAAAGVWNPPREVAAELNLHNQSFNTITSISCASPGDCSAVGFFEQWAYPAGGYGGFTIDESNGTWGAALKVPGSSSSNSYEFAAISCASAGNCAAVGTYNGYSAFVMDERGGVWGDPKVLAGAVITPGSGAWFKSVACSAVGQCVAGGDLAGAQSFVVTEAGGNWGTPQVVLDGGRYAVGITSVACPSTGNCVVGGYEGYVGGQLAVVVNESGGTWGSARVVADSLHPVTDTELDSVTAVSCSSVGNCAAGGYYGSSSYQQDFVVSETNGTWGSAHEVAGALNVSDVGSRTGGIQSISCPTDGYCAAGGSYFDAGANLRAFVVDEVAGNWGTARQAAGSLNVGGRSWISSVSCASAGNCSAGGYFTNAAGGFAALVVTESNGSWDGGQAVARSPITNSAAQVTSISCPSAGNCVAGGFLFDATGYRQAFVVDQTPDVTPPKVSMSGPGAAVTLSTSVHASWSASDPSGIDHFDVKVQSAPWNGAFGSWSMWKVKTTATSANFGGTYGRTYCFEVRAQDRSGNVSAWSSPRCTAVPLRSDQLSRSAGWSKHASTSYFAGFAYSTKTHGASMTRTGVSGKRLSLVATTCSSCGTVAVRWNGTLVKSINLHGTTTKHRQVIALSSFAASKNGNLTVAVTSPTGESVIIEGIAINHT